MSGAGRVRGRCVGGAGRRPPGRCPCRSRCRCRSRSSVPCRSRRAGRRCRCRVPCLRCLVPVPCRSRCRCPCRSRRRCVVGALSVPVSRRLVPRRPLSRRPLSRRPLSRRPLSRRPWSRRPSSCRPLPRRPGRQAPWRPAVRLLPVSAFCVSAAGGAALGEDRRVGVGGPGRRGRRGEVRVGGHRRGQRHDGLEHPLLVDELVVALLLAHALQRRADGVELADGDVALPPPQRELGPLQPRGHDLCRLDRLRPLREEHLGDRPGGIARHRGAPAGGGPAEPQRDDDDGDRGAAQRDAPAGATAQPAEDAGATVRVRDSRPATDAAVRGPAAAGAAAAAPATRRTGPAGSAESAWGRGPALGRSPAAGSSLTVGGSRSGESEVSWESVSPAPVSPGSVVPAPTSVDPPAGSESGELADPVPAVSPTGVSATGRRSGASVGSWPTEAGSSAIGEAVSASGRALAAQAASMAMRGSSGSTRSSAPVEVAAAEGVDERIVGAHGGQVDRLVAEQGVEQQVVEVRRVGEVRESAGSPMSAGSSKSSPRSSSVRVGGVCWAVGCGHTGGTVVRRTFGRPRLRRARVGRVRTGVVAVAPSRVPHACPPHGPHRGPPHASSAQREPLLRIVLALYRVCVKPVPSPPFRTPPVTPTAARHPDLGRTAPPWAERVHRGLMNGGGTRPAGFCRCTRNNDPHDGGGGGAGGRPADRRPGGCASARARPARAYRRPGRTRTERRSLPRLRILPLRRLPRPAPAWISRRPRRPLRPRRRTTRPTRLAPTRIRPRLPTTWFRPRPTTRAAAAPGPGRTVAPARAASCGGRPAAAPPAAPRRRRRSASRRSPDGHGRGRRGVGGPHPPAGAPSGSGARTGPGRSRHRRRRRDARGAAHPGRLAGHRHRGYRPRRHPHRRRGHQRAPGARRVDGHPHLPGRAQQHRPRGRLGRGGGPGVAAHRRSAGAPGGAPGRARRGATG